MLPVQSTLRQIRHYLHHELRKIYPDSESASVTRQVMEHAGFPLPVYLRETQLIPGAAIISQINEIVTEIHTRKPIQYILGYTLFCEMKILVNENVLIPRPETEEMISRIFDRHPKMPGSVLDIGTGSGCMALALKNRYRDSQVTALDISKAALGVAEENARRNDLEICLVQGDILTGSEKMFREGFELIVSNPPYVRISEKSNMQVNVLNFEPELALFVEDNEPLVFYDAIAAFCSKNLNPGGTLWVEINEQFGKEVAGVFEKWGMEKIIIHKDIHEKERFIEAAGI